MGNWLIETKKGIVIKYVLFIISPFIAFVFSLGTLKTKSSFVVIYLFFVFLGLSYTVPNNRNVLNFDGVTYRQDFEEYKFVSSTDFIANFKDYINFEGDADFYCHFVYYCVSRITDNYHVMFMIIAMVFSFFSLKSFEIFIREKQFVNSIPCFILAYLFMSNQIFNINAFRFFTAAWIAVYSLLNIFVKKNNLYVCLLFLTPMIHGSFFLMLVVYLIYLLLGRYDKFWIIVFIISSFFSNFILELAQKYLTSMPSFIFNNYSGYFSDNYVDLINNSGSGFIWVKRLLELLVRLCMNVYVILFIFHLNMINRNIKTGKMISFILILMSVVNLTSVIPSLGKRYLLLTMPFIAYIWLVNFEGKKYNKYLYPLGVLFILLFFLPFQVNLLPCLSHYNSVLESTFYISSPLYLIYKYWFV